MPKPFDYVITHSGREVSPTRGVPSLEDLALSLSRQPRFGGMCRTHWTVVDHSLFAALLAQRDGQIPEVQLALLLHDAHEWTGDIPTHFKHPGQRQLQREQDWRIFSEHFPDQEVEPSYYYEKMIKEYDRRALLAEALVVGPPKFRMSSDVLEHFGERPRLRDVVALLNRIRNGELGVHPSELAYAVGARNAHAFIKRVQQLQQEIAAQPIQTTPRGFVANETRGNNVNE